MNIPIMTTSALTRDCAFGYNSTTKAVIPLQRDREKTCDITLVMLALQLLALSLLYNVPLCVSWRGLNMALLLCPILFYVLS